MTFANTEAQLLHVLVIGNQVSYLRLSAFNEKCYAFIDERLGPPLGGDDKALDRFGQGLFVTRLQKRT